MELFDKEIEKALMCGEDPQEHMDSLTRLPSNIMRLSPEQRECGHPEETLSFDSWNQVMKCGTCGAELLISDVEGSLDKPVS